MTATPEVTPSLEPTPTAAVALPPERPAEMDLADEVGAAAAGDYFLRLFSYVYASGDVAEWDRVGVEGCTFCSGVQADVAAVYSSGGHYAGGALTYSPPAVVGYEESLGVYAVEVQYSTAEFTEVAPDGSVVRRLPAETGFLILDVMFTADGWLLLTGDANEESVR